MRVTTKPVSDPRPIRDENYLETSKGNLRLFMEKRGCTLNLINSLESTSFKSIIAVFHFLLKQLDQMLKFGQKSDEDIPLILKSLNYPVTIPRDTFIPFSKRSKLSNSSGGIHPPYPSQTFAKMPPDVVGTLEHG